MESVSTAFDQGSPSTSQAGDAPTGLTFIKHQVSVVILAWRCFWPNSAGELKHYFARPQVTKMDTLAGLAIKYNVSVSRCRREFWRREGPGFKGFVAKSRARPFLRRRLGTSSAPTACSRTQQCMGGGQFSSPLGICQSGESRAFATGEGHLKRYLA